MSGARANGTTADAQRVVVYGRVGDEYTKRAKALLAMKGVAYAEQFVTPNELAKRFGVREYPQIVIAGTHIGSFEQLGQLELQGKLDALLAGRS